MKEIMKRTLRREVVLRGIEKRGGEAGRFIMIAELDELGDKDEILERGGKIKRKGGVGVDEDLTLEERKISWRILETARRERARGSRVYERVMGGRYQVELE